MNNVGMFIQYAIIHNTLKNSEVNNSGLFTGHRQTSIITCERKCTNILVTLEKEISDVRPKLCTL